MTVLCILIGHDFVNEVQVTAQIFFPRAGFKIVHEKPNNLAESILGIEFAVECLMHDSTITAVIYRHGEAIATYAYPLDSDTQKPYLNDRRRVMLAVYFALQLGVGAYTPWGALTGIRPSKLVREWLDSDWFSSENKAQEIAQTLMDTFYVHEAKAWLALDVAKREQIVNKRIWDSPSATHLMTPVGIYASIPFCPTRCVYCSFNTSHKPPAAQFLGQYVAILAAECRQKAQYLQEIGGRVSSIYIGGGTPTALPDYLLTHVLEAIGSAFEPFFNIADIEYTVEGGRPDTFTPENLRLLKDYGVTRLAVNPQTLNDCTLKTIGRNHTAADFFRAFDLASNVGFRTINTDIIAGLPGETEADMHRNMEALAKYAPENITIHTLAVKRASKLNEHHGEYMLPQLENIEKMLQIAHDGCVSSGLHPYYLYRQKNMVGRFENVGYAKDGHECQYNVGMMAETQSILGLGAGAVTKIIEGGKITRTFNPKDVELYIARNKL